MADDFEMLSERAQQVLEAAQEDARYHTFDDPTVTLVDLLVAVMRHANGEALLLAIGGSQERFHAWRDSLLGALNVPKRTAGNVESKPPLPLSDEVRYAIDLARAETNHPDMKSDQVRVEHLLVGIIYASDEKLAGVLKEHGFTVEHIHSRVSQAAAEAMQAMATGAELRIWGTKEAVTRLMHLSAQLDRSMDDLVWDAIERTWFTDVDPAPDTPIA